jgi:hypothetical protein
MPLSAGTHLGPYKILAMGEVRDVAIKILLVAFAATLPLWLGFTRKACQEERLNVAKSPFARAKRVGIPTQ